jgi:O-antigen/teichoic acid export membrane protein
MLLRNTLFMGLTTLFRLGTGFFSFVLIARFLGASAFGTLMYWMTISALVALVVGFGTGAYMLKEIGANPAQRLAIVGGVGASKIVLAGIVAIASLLATPWIKHPELYWLLLATAMGDIVVEYIFCAFRGAGDFLTEVWFSTATSCTHLGLIALAVHMDASLTTIAITFMVSRALSACAAAVLHRLKLGKFGVLQHWDSWRNILIKNRAYAADAFLTNVYTQLDTLLINHLSGPAALGVYQAGLRLMQGLNKLAQVLSNVYLPKISHEIRNQEDHSHTAGLLYYQLVGFGLISALLLGFGSAPITDLVYGPAYGDLQPLLPWFGALLLMRLFAGNFGILLTAAGHQSTRAFSNIVCIVIMVVVGYLLIPSYGALGMVWSALLATTVLAAIYTFKTYHSAAAWRWSYGQKILSGIGFAGVVAMLLWLQFVPQ